MRDAPLARVVGRCEPDAVLVVRLRSEDVVEPRFTGAFFGEFVAVVFLAAVLRVAFFLLVAFFAVFSLALRVVDFFDVALGLAFDLLDAALRGGLAFDRRLGLLAVLMGAGR